MKYKSPALSISEMALQYYAGIDNCVRSNAKYATELEGIIGKCLEISEDLNEMAGDDEIPALRSELRSSLLSLAGSDIKLKQMSEATQKCKAVIREFSESNNTGEGMVPNLPNLYEEELQSIACRSDDAPESHQALKEFDNTQKSQPSTSSREVEQQPMDSSGLIFSQVEEGLHCPITKKPFEDPMRNQLCNHCYSKAAIDEILTRKHSIKCPVGGCTRKVTKDNLIPDRELARRVRRKMKQDKYEKQHTAEPAVQL